MKKQSKILTLLLLAAVISSNLALAETLPVQRALDNVKEKIDDLITAKDENDTSLSFSLRVEAFKKVIELSLSEAKELKIKLLSIDLPQDELLLLWRDEMIKKLDEAITYYEKTKELKNEPQNINDIKALAQNFKEWRDSQYLPVSNAINDFLLIRQEEKAIEIATKRSQKIAEDLVKLQRSKITAIVKKLPDLYKALSRADISIEEAKKQNDVARELFFERNVALFEPKNVSTSTEASSSLLIANNSESDAPEAATSSVEENLPPLSIKDLVRSSLDKIKDAYRIFIEMSNLVRKLLG